MDKKNFIGIYGNIIEQTNEIMGKIETTIDEIDDVETKEQSKNILGFLSAQRQNLENSVRESEKNSNWDTFTIAFYGETNAGKSTIVETLRLYLKEETKFKQQKHFQDNSSSLLSIKKKLKDLESTKRDNVAQEEKVKGEISVFEKQKEEAKQECDQALDELKKEEKFLIAIVETRNIWESLLFKIPVFIRLKLGMRTTKLEQNRAVQESKQKDKNRIVENFNKEIRSANLKAGELKRNSDALEKESKYLNGEKEKELKKLAPYMDGLIIGDGNLDYTRETIRYDFKVSEKTFAVLDLPGIEGDEKKFQDEIKQSLQKSHVVFYITSKAAPPQSGDNNQDGVLNKIARHLGDQTQVYAIYNHRITCPNSLREILITDEKTALKELDAKMKEVLKEHYKSTITLSAMPAFLSIAENLNFNYERQREKFLDAFSKEDIIKRSCFDGFISFITDEIVLHSDKKIIEANKNKIIFIIEDLIFTLNEILKTYREFSKRTEKECGQCKCAIDVEFDAFKKDISKHTSKVVEEFKQNARKQAYDFIDKDVSDDDLEKKLPNILRDALKDVETNFREFVQKACSQYQESLKRELKRLEGHIKDFEKIFELEIDKNLNNDMEIKRRKISDYLILYSVIAGFVVAIRSRVGRVVVVLNAVEVVLSVVNFTLPIFKEKKTYQREFVDKSISKTSKELSKKLKDASKQTEDHVTEGNKGLFKEIYRLDSAIKQNEKTIGDFIGFIKKTKQSVIRGENYGKRNA